MLIILPYTSSEKFRKAGNPLRKKLREIIIPPNPTKEVIT
jgi:hypothetical protein